MTGLHKIVPSGSAWFVLLLIMSAMSCTTPEMKPLICPPPPQPVCSPGTFDKTLLDTVFHGLGHTQSHITMLPVPPNSSAQDFAITFIPDPRGGSIALITSNRASAEQDNGSANTQRLFSARFFTTTKFGPLKEVQIGNVPLPVGTAFYSKADHLLYFSAKAKNDDPDDYDLYTATVQVDGDQVTLSDVHAITSLNAEGHFDSQPTLDATGTHIYFVSDRPGGNGGTDIWFSERTSASTNDWSKPQPLPEPVNSACDELSPFMLASDPNTLYFSSNGHETVGGYDLFKTHITNGRSAGSLLYSEPENLGKPINTPYDEVFPSALNDTAFFWSSDAPASEAGMNLYTITHTFIPQLTANGEVPAPGRIEADHLQEDTTQPPSPTMSAPPTTPMYPLSQPAPPVLGSVDIVAHVTRGMDNHPAKGADFYIRKDSEYLYRGTVPESGTVDFKVNRDSEYDVGAETEEAFFDVKHVDLRGNKDSVISIYLHLPDTLVIRINFPFDDREHPYEFTIDENGQASTSTWQQVLDLTAHAALRSMSDLKELILIGHTDSLGTDAYNDRLGFERATFVANELEKRGIPKSIIHVKSAGRTEPVLRRHDESDETFRLRSRRVEFIKVFK
jgi:OmpA family/WD40-like Beta Propeller Repeat